MAPSVPPGAPFVVEAAEGVLANDVDPNGDALTASVVGAPASGDLDLAADGAFVSTPDDGFVGQDGFVYAVTDGAHTSQAAVALTVQAGPGDTGDTGGADDSDAHAPGCGCGGGAAGGVIPPLGLLAAWRRRRRSVPDPVADGAYRP